MNQEELKKIIEFIEGYYHRKLEINELKMLKEEVRFLSGYQEFIEKFKYVMLKRMPYFSVRELHQIIIEDKDIEKYKKDLGITSWEELYEN